MNNLEKQIEVLEKLLKLKDEYIKELETRQNYKFMPYYTNHLHQYTMFSPSKCITCGYEPYSFTVTSGSTTNPGNCTITTTGYVSKE